MSAEGPRFPSSEKSYDNTEKKKKPTKKGAAVSLPGLVEIGTEPNEAAKEPTAIEKMLADLAAKRASKPEKAPAEPDKVEKPEPVPVEAAAPLTDTEAVSAETPVESVAEAETVEEEPETVEADSGETHEEELPIYELEPTAFSGGEVIIDLKGSKPVAERVELLPPKAEPEPAFAGAEGEPATTEPPAPTFEATPPELTPEVPAAGGGGEVPPIPPPEVFRPVAEQPPEPPAQETIYEPAAIRQKDMYPYAPASEKPASAQEVQNALYYAEKSGQNRGVLAGLLAGGLYEHFKHKRREKKQEKRFKTQTKELEQVRKDNLFARQEHERQHGEQQRAYATLEKRVENAPKPEKLIAATPERSKLEESEQLAVPAGHHLETSAWHTIEVDTKTGKAVEKPAFEYGREYSRERAHEAAAPDTEPSAKGGGTPSDVPSAPQSSLPAGDPYTAAPIPLATTQGTPSGPVQQAKPDQKSTGHSSSQPLWPWITALVIIAICLAALLR